MSRVATDVTIAASAIVVLAALVGVARAVFRFAVNIRDNTKATRDLTGKLEDLTVSIDGRFDALADRVARLEGRRTR